MEVRLLWIPFIAVSFIVWDAAGLPVAEQHAEKTGKTSGIPQHTSDLQGTVSDCKADDTSQTCNPRTSRGGYVSAEQKKFADFLDRVKKDRNARTKKKRFSMISWFKQHYAERFKTDTTPEQRRRDENIDNRKGNEIISTLEDRHDSLQKSDHNHVNKINKIQTGVETNTKQLKANPAENEIFKRQSTNRSPVPKYAHRRVTNRVVTIEMSRRPHGNSISKIEQPVQDFSEKKRVLRQTSATIFTKRSVKPQTTPDPYITTSLSTMHTRAESRPIIDTDDTSNHITYMKRTLKQSQDQEPVQSTQSFSTSTPVFRTTRSRQMKIMTDSASGKVEHRNGGFTTSSVNKSTIKSKEHDRHHGMATSNSLSNNSENPTTIAMSSVTSDQQTVTPTSAQSTSRVTSAYRETKLKINTTTAAPMAQSSTTQTPSTDQSPTRNVTDKADTSSSFSKDQVLRLRSIYVLYADSNPLPANNMPTINLKAGVPEHVTNSGNLTKKLIDDGILGGGNAPEYDQTMSTVSNKLQKGTRSSPPTNKMKQYSGVAVLKNGHLFLVIYPPVETANDSHQHAVNKTNTKPAEDVNTKSNSQPQASTTPLSSSASSVDTKQTLPGHIAHSTEGISTTPYVVQRQTVTESSYVSSVVPTIDQLSTSAEHSLTIPIHTTETSTSHGVTKDVDKSAEVTETTPSDITTTHTEVFKTKFTQGHGVTVTAKSHLPRNIPIRQHKVKDSREGNAKTSVFHHLNQMDNLSKTTSSLDTNMNMLHTDHLVTTEHHRMSTVHEHGIHQGHTYDVNETDTSSKEVNTEPVPRFISPWSKIDLTVVVPAPETGESSLEIDQRKNLNVLPFIAKAKDPFLSLSKVFNVLSTEIAKQNNSRINPRDITVEDVVKGACFNFQLEARGGVDLFDIKNILPTDNMNSTPTHLSKPITKKPCTTKKTKGNVKDINQAARSNEKTTISYRSSSIVSPMATRMPSKSTKYTSELPYTTTRAYRISERTSSTPTFWSSGDRTTTQKIEMFNVAIPKSVKLTQRRTTTPSVISLSNTGIPPLVRRKAWEKALKFSKGMKTLTKEHETSTQNVADKEQTTANTPYRETITLANSTPVFDVKSSDRILQTMLHSEAKKRVGSRATTTSSPRKVFYPQQARPFFVRPRHRQENIHVANNVNLGGSGTRSVLEDALNVMLILSVEDLISDSPGLHGALVVQSAALMDSLFATHADGRRQGN